MSAPRDPSPERAALLAVLRPLVLEIMGERGEVLADLRLERGWTQQQLSMESGVAQSTISHIESGRSRVLAVTVAALASALGMPHARVAAACRRGRRGV